MNNKFDRIVRAMEDCRSNDLDSLERRLSLVAYYLVGRFGNAFVEADVEHITELLRND